MKIAIAGAGDLSRYFYEEYTRHGHETIALTRSHKEFLDNLSVEQRITDYTVPDLITQLSDCDAVVSTISGQGPDHVTAHLALLEACKKSPQCKRMIPSEWTGNIEDYPDQPIYMVETREPVRQALAAQKKVQWTLVLNGWFMEYLLPRHQRYFHDLGDGAWPMEHERKVFMLYEKGHRAVTLTSARDTARAVARLVEQPVWEKYTHLAGETLTWQELYKILHRRDGEWTPVRRSFADAVKQVVKVETEGGSSRVNAHLQLLGYTDFNQVAVEKVRRQKDLYFPGLYFRTVEEILNEAESKPQAVV